MMNDPRVVLERLCAERGEDFAGLSRMLGRNPAYIQQFVRRGVPKRLGEAERRKLARYFLTVGNGGTALWPSKSGSSALFFPVFYYFSAVSWALPCSYICR